MKSNKLLNFTNLKAVLIDLDGTIADSIPILYNVYATFLKEYGRQGSKEEFQSLMGPSLIEIVKKIKLLHELDDKLDAMIKKYFQMLLWHYSHDVKLFDGVREFLNYANEKKLKLALVTSAGKHLSEAFLNSCNLSTLFDLVMTGDKVTKGKPSPEIYQKALQELNVAPEEAIAVEDSPKGIESALNAGLAVLCFNPISKISFGNRVLPVHSWQEILNLFQNKI